MRGEERNGPREPANQGQGRKQEVSAFLVDSEGSRSNAEKRERESNWTDLVQHPSVEEPERNRQPSVRLGSETDRGERDEGRVGSGRCSDDGEDVEEGEGAEVVDGIYDTLPSVKRGRRRRD